ncbi:MAG: single-stranded DNA-binding protein [Candidatus Omnitrophica bacterium]|nr:single-stranded DNA-binding protein [Candidatus Omnitrophota bacterium]
MNINRVMLAGNLTRDPEMRFTPSGTAVANLGLAVNREYTTKEGERKKEVSFIRIVTWGKQAQSCQEHLKKGSSILVEGRLQSRSWETAEKEKRNTLEVTAERVHFLTRSDRPGFTDQASSAQTSRRTEEQTIGEENFEYDEPEEQKEG